MPATDASTDNGINNRDIKLLGYKIDTLTTTVKEFCDNMEPRVRGVETKQAVIVERIETAEDEISILRKVTGVWSSLNSIFVGIATYLGLK